MEKDMTKITREDQFPKEFKDYIEFLEAELETPIKSCRSVRIENRQS